MLCIYCKEDKPKTDEHIVPYAFIRTKAKFVVLSEEVCGDCNEKLGREVDRYFAQETLEGAMRYHHGVRTGDRPRPQDSAEFRLPDDPESFGKWAGAYGWIDGSDGKFLLYDQVHIIDRETGETTLCIGIEGLDQLIGTRWIETGRKLDFKILAVGDGDQLSEGKVRALQKRLDELIPGGQVHEEFTAPETLTGATEVPVDMVGRVTTQALRAYAKILFNFAAKYLSYEETMKPEWDAVRMFISEGTGKLEHSLSHNTPFWGEETEDQRIDMGVPGFNVRLQNVGGNVVGEVQFYNLVTYKITLLESYAVPRQVAGMFTKNRFYEAEPRIVSPTFTDLNQ